MTKNELRDALTLAGIPFKSKDTVATLEALYASRVEAAVAIVEADMDAHAKLDVLVPVVEGSPVDLARKLELSENEKAAIADEAAHRLAGCPGALYPDVNPHYNPAPLAVVTEPFDTGINYRTASEEVIREANCPHCGIHLSNGLLHVTDESGDGKGSYFAQRAPAFEAGEWCCMGCNGHFGQPVEYPAPAAPAPKGTGIKIEKGREERNGIKRPSAGGKCRAVWDALDEYVELEGTQPDAKVVKAWALENGWNPNNASIEFYQWRKFNGITGRAPKAEAPAA